MCGKRNMFKIKPNFALRILLDTGHKLIRRSEDILNKPLMYVQLTSCVQGVHFLLEIHLAKSVQIKSFFWSECGKIRTRKNSVFVHFSRSDNSSHS